MIFPYDVNHTVNESNKAFGENRGQTILVIFFFGSALLLVGAYYLLHVVLGFPIALSIVLYIFVLCIVGVLLFRFVIFDEDEKKRESSDSAGDSFAKYMWLRADVQTTVDVGSNGVNVFEYVDGSAMCTMEIRFGSNNAEKAAATRELNETLVRIASENGLETRIIDCPENFRNSNEFRKYTNAVNAIKDKRAARNIMIISDAIMEESYRLCNVDVVYVMFRTQSAYQRADLELALRRVFKAVRECATAYRSIHFLDINELMEFYREFYGIAAIDLTMLRTVSLAEQITTEYDDVVSVLELRAQSGKVFTSSNQVVFEEVNRVN